MKTTLILLTIIFAAAWAGCSDNLNLTDPLEGQNSIAKNQVDPSVDEKDPTIEQRNPEGDDGSIELLWSLDELSVKATSESKVEDEAFYDNTSVPIMPSDYLITFNVSSNAEVTANGYSPSVRVSKDDETMYTESHFASGGEVWAHKELRFRKGTFSQIAFYIALSQVNNGIVDDGNVNTARLTLKDINIYRVK